MSTEDDGALEEQGREVGSDRRAFRRADGTYQFGEQTDREVMHSMCDVTAPCGPDCLPRKPIVTPLAGGGYHIDSIGPGESVELEFKFPVEGRVLASETYELSTPEERRADRAEARHRTHIESYATRERSGPPILGIVVIYVVLCLLVGLTFWFALPRIW